MRRSPTVLFAVLLTAGTLLTGCTAGSADSDSTASTESAGGSAGGRGRAPDAAAPEAGPADGTAEEPTSLTSGRIAPGSALIRTADLSVRVDDVGAAADEAGRLATGAGGAVESEERSGGGQGPTEEGPAEDGSAVVVLRVPPRSFAATLSRLAGLGEELTRRVGTEDVTDQVVDLDSRIATQRASVARVSALLDRAANLGEVVKIEGELTRRTADLESLESRLAVLEERADLSTITARFEGADAQAAVTDPGPRGFGDGLSAGWRALVELARGVGLAVGAVLPFSPLLLVAGALLWRARGRRGVRGATLPGTAGA